MKLTISEGHHFGVSVDEEIGEIHIKSGVTANNQLYEVIVESQSPWEVVLYTAEVYYNSYTHDMSVNLKKEVICVCDGGQAISWDVVTLKDETIFPWVDEVKGPNDFELNPVTQHSKFAHLVKADTPLFVSDNLWISSKSNVYLRFGTVWTCCAGNLENVEQLERYMHTNHYTELQRYLLAQKLME